MAMPPPADIRTADEHYNPLSGKVCQVRPQHNEHEDHPAVLPSGQETLQNVVLHQLAHSTDSMAETPNNNCVVELVTEFIDTIQPEI